MHYEDNDWFMRNMKYYCIIVGLVISLLVGCQRPSSTERTEEETKILACIDDSVDALSPHAPKLIEQAMKSAADSMAYYEAYVRKAKWYCLSATPDSLDPIVAKTIAFSNWQPTSPRLNSLLAYAYNLKAVKLHNFRQKPDEVVRLYRKVTDLLANSDSKDQLPMVCANLGDAYIFKSQLPEAAAWYRRALFLVDSLKLPAKENITLYLGLATIYLQLNDFDTSLKYYQQTEKYFSQMSVSMQAYYLNNYGSYYYYAKDYQASLKKFLVLKSFLEKHGKTTTFDMYLCKLNLSDVYLNLGNVAMSEKYLDEIAPWFNANGDDVSTYYVNSIRIGQAVKRGDMAQVRNILQREKTLDNVDFSLRQIRNRYLRKYYEAMGDYRQAYANLKEDMQKDDSLEHNRTKMRASEIMERFAQDTIQLHHSLVMEHKNAVIQRANSIAAVALVLVIGLVLALLFMHARKRYAQDRLRIMQLKLDGARNRISPHFVFNVLNDKIVKSDSKEADELLDLTKLIRANLDLAGKLEVSLKEELDFVKRYVDVEKHGVGEDFQLRVDVADEVDIDKVHIPSMFIQILVENAFVHGLKGWEGHKAISVIIQRDHHVVSIKVRDNGPGFDARCMGKKRTGLNIITQTISIINERNKNKMTFSLHNQQEAGKVMGCEATVTIPDNINYFTR